MPNIRKEVNTMEKIFEIVKSYIPEDKQADVKAEIGGKLEATLANREKEIKRELSSKFKVDLFAEDIEKAYKNNAFIKKEDYDKVVEENKKILTNLESLTKTKEELEKEKETFENERKTYDSSLNLVSAGFNPERLHLIKNELTGNAEEDVKNIKDKYPEMFQVIAGKNPYGKKDPEPKKNEAQLYIERRKKEIERKI